MKTRMLRIVAIGFWVATALSSAVAQYGSAADAVQFLSATKPSYCPAVDLHLIDPKQRQAFEVLYKAQMQALYAAKDCSNPSAVPVLIPYLNYTRHLRPSVIMMKDGDDYNLPKDLAGIAKECPAFAALIKIPGSSFALAAYVANTKYELSYRVTAFQVLRYLDRGRFDALATVFNRSIAAAHGDTKRTVSLIENNNLPFDGICPVELEN